MQISESILSAFRRPKTEMPKPNMPNVLEPATWETTSPQQRLVKTARRAKAKRRRKKKKTSCCRTSSRRPCHSLLLRSFRGHRLCRRRLQQYKGREVIVGHHVSSLHKAHAIVERIVSSHMAEARGATRGPRDVRVLMVAHPQQSNSNHESHSFALHSSKVVVHHHVQTVACIPCRKEKIRGSLRRSSAKVGRVRMERIVPTRIVSFATRLHQ